MSRPPIDLDDSTAVLAVFGDIPLRVHPRCTDVLVLLAGDDRRARMIVTLDDIPNRLPQHERVQAFGRFWRHVHADVPTVAAAAVAIYRDGHPDPTGEDFSWHDAIRATAAHAGITCLGVYLATDHGAVQLLPRAA